MRKVFTGFMLALVSGLAFVTYPSLRRYLKIERM
jgi:hypothetical protein